jgi:hypothetical protein
MENPDCGKVGYTRHHAETMRKNIYNKGKRKTRLRIYQCDKCFMFHLTSSINKKI